ncbi:MAG TPA: hypothetical protein VE029_04065 [Rhizobacter sp.]|nr:hypothetical protein [Rhizobacter sp.]
MAAGLAVASPAAQASGLSLPSAAGWLMLPFLLAAAVAMHIAIGRGAKALAAVLSPLTRGELEVSGYERRVYGTAVRAMQEIVGLVLLAGLVVWLGMAWGLPWATPIGALILVAAVVLDLLRWERVNVSASYVWFQRGLGQSVHQVALENIRDVSVVETEARGFTLRRLNRNRLCRLNLRMNDKRVVALPKTDAYSELDAVEAAANLVRTRQQLLDSRAGHRQAHPKARKADEVTTQPAVHDREMMRELKRLRRCAKAASGVPTPSKG